MKKGFMALVLCLAMVFSLAVPAFAATEETEGWTYDLTTITEESAIIHQEITPTEDGFIKTTVTATRPKYRARSNVGEVTVTTTKDIYSSNAGGYFAYVSLTTDFWFDSTSKNTGWSDATVDYDYTGTHDGVADFGSSKAFGTAGTTLGKRWTKVATNWFVEYKSGIITEGTVWNKITHEGKLTSSED